MFKKFNLKRSAIVLGSAVASGAMAVPAFAEVTVDYSGITTGLTTQISNALTAALPVLGIIMGIVLGVKLYRKFAGKG